MIEFWKRVDDLLTDDLTQMWLSSETGINQSTISGWKNKNRIPPADRAAKIARALGVSVEFLVFGDSFDEDEDETTEHLCPATQEVKAPFLTPSQKVYTLSTNQKVVNIPIWDQKVSAGHGEYLIEEFKPERVLPVLERLVARYEREKLHVVEVKGDSMTGIQLFGGDLVVFAKDYIESDGIYVISINDEAYVKRLEFDPMNDQIVVHSENKKYQPKVIPANSENVRIEGKVIGWYHNHPY